MHLLNTLYLTTPESYLRLDNDTLRVMVGDETRLRVPLHHLPGVLLLIIPKPIWVLVHLRLNFH